MYKIIAGRISGVFHTAAESVKGNLINHVQHELETNPHTEIVVLNRYFTLDNLYDQHKFEALEGCENIFWQAPKLIIIDSKDLLPIQIASFSGSPPRFCGTILENTRVMIIEKELASEDVLEECEEVVFNSPLVETTIELDDNESAVLELLERLTIADVYEELVEGKPIVIRHFHELSKTDENDIRAMIIAKFGAEIPGIDEQLSFHHGLLETEICDFSSLLTRERVSTDSKLVIVNSETINELHHSLLIEGGTWQVGNGLLESIDEIQLLVTDELSLKDWQLLFTIIKHEKSKSKVVDLTIQEGVAVPKGLKTTLQSVSRTEILGLKSREVSDLSVELAKIKCSKRQVEVSRAAELGLSAEEEFPPFIVSVSEGLSLEHLLGHVSLHQETKSAINPIESSDFYHALDSGRPIIFTNLNRNPRLSKQLEMLYKGSPTVSPSLYYLGKKYDFPKAKIVIMNERRERFDEKIKSLEEKLQQAIQDVIPGPCEDKRFKTDFKALATKVLLPLAREGYDHVLDYSYLRKLCCQVLVEQEFDKSSTITNYHLRKAFSTTIKEFKLSECYESYKKLVWEGFDKPKLEEAQKALKAIIMNMIQDPENLIETIPSGYSQLIENAVKSNNFSPLPEILGPCISESKENLDIGNRSEASLAKQNIKDRRLKLKLKAHKAILVLGPTGSGKTEQGLRIARKQRMRVIRATLGPATEPADLMGTLTTDPVDDAQIKFLPGKINEWLEKGGMLLLDEVTMVKNWDIFESYFEHGSFIIDGKEVVPPKDSVVYMTGNESGNGEYGGRSLPRLLRQHAMIVKKPGMSQEDLMTHIVEPLCQDLEGINVRELSEKFFSIIQLSQELGVPDYAFSTREIKDIVTRCIKKISEGRAVAEIGAAALYNNLFKLCRETLISLVATDKLATLDTKLRAITDYQGHYDIDLKAQLMERTRLLDQKDPYGLKPGIILNGLAEEDTISCLEGLYDITPFIYQTGGQWASLMETVREKYELGQKLVVENAHLVPTEFWESLVNEFMTEPKKGFMLILLNTSTNDEKWIAPSLRSRFAMMTEKSKTPITAVVRKVTARGPGVDDVPDHIEELSSEGVEFEVVEQGDERVSPISWLCCWRKRKKRASSKPFKENFSLYLDNITFLPEELPMRMPRVYPDFPENYIRQDILEIDYKTMHPYKKKSEKKDLKSGPRVDNIPEADTIKWTEKISLNFDDEGFAKVPSMSCYQRIEKYKTNNNSALDFYQDDDGEFYVKQSCFSGEAPRILQLLASTPTTFINPEVSSTSEMPEEFRTTLDTFFETDKGKEIKGEIEIQAHDSRDDKIQKLDCFFQNWGHGKTRFSRIARPVDEFLHLLKNKKGVCRHRALVGKVLCDYFGIPSRLESNTAHVWLSVCGDDNIWKRLEVHKEELQVVQAQRSSTSTTYVDYTPRRILVPREITLAKLDNRVVNIELLKELTFDGKNLVELLVKKETSKRSATTGTLSIEMLTRGSRSPFKAATICTTTKGILTDSRLPSTLKDLFDRAGIVTDSIDEILAKLDIRPITDEIIDAIRISTEINGLDDYLQVNIDELIQLLNPDPKKIDLSGIRLPQDKLLGIIMDSNNLEELNLFGHDLSHVTDEQWNSFIEKNKTLKKLYLGYCQLTKIPQELGQLNSLKELLLCYNQLTEIPAELGQLNSLTKLSLANNQLTTVPAELGQLNSLKELLLCYNQLTEIPAELGQLNSLKELLLCYNQLTEIPAELGQLNSLTDLNLIGNQLTSLPAEIRGLNSLTDLNLIGNQLTSLPAEIGALSSLAFLNLIGNQLTSLPAEIRGLNSLTHLNLDCNQLTSLPAEIGQLGSLNQLNLDNNRLTSLPAEIGQLGDLTNLKLYGNQLTSLPAEIVQLGSLTHLELSKNQLTSLPAEIGQLRALTHLYLNLNQLTTIPEELGDLHCLEVFHLRDNLLKVIPEKVEALKRKQPCCIIGHDFF